MKRAFIYAGFRPEMLVSRSKAALAFCIIYDPNLQVCIKLFGGLFGLSDDLVKRLVRNGTTEMAREVCTISRRVGAGQCLASLGMCSSPHTPGVRTSNEFNDTSTHLLIGLCKSVGFERFVHAPFGIFGPVLETQNSSAA